MNALPWISKITFSTIEGDGSLRPKLNHFIDKVLLSHPCFFFFFSSLLWYILLSQCHWWEHLCSAGLYGLVNHSQMLGSSPGGKKRCGWRDLTDLRLPFRSQHCTATISPLRGVNIIIAASYCYWRVGRFPAIELSAVLNAFTFVWVPSDSVAVNVTTSSLRMCKLMNIPTVTFYDSTARSWQRWDWNSNFSDSKYLAHKWLGYSELSWITGTFAELSEGPSPESF